MAVARLIGRILPRVSLGSGPEIRTGEYLVLNLVAIGQDEQDRKDSPWPDT